MRSYGQYCALAKALDVVGDRWNLLIVRELALQGPCRYTDLQHGLPGIATNLLGDRLRDLEAAGVVDRRAEPPPVATTLFSLTEWGRELEPVLVALGRWGARRLAGGPGPGDQFRSHWLSFPLRELLVDADPGAAPVVMEVRAGDRPVRVDIGGTVTARAGAAPDAHLVLEAEAPVVLGLLTGRYGLREARRLGLATRGDVSVLKRLRPAG